MFTTTSAILLLLFSARSFGAPSGITPRQKAPLACTIDAGGIANPTGTLRMYSTPQAVRYDSEILPPNGVQLGVGPEPFVVSANSDSTTTNFRFQQCNSTYLGYTQGEGTGSTSGPGNLFYYGLVVPLFANGSMTPNCLNATVDSSLPSLIKTPVCSYTDDSSQLSQFWSLAYEVSDGTVNTTSAVLTFVGKTADTRAGYYSTGFANGSYGEINAQVNFEDGLNFASEYAIDLIPAS